MAIAASRPLDMPRQQAFWLLHLAGWSAYFAQGCLYAVATDFMRYLLEGTRMSTG